MKLTIIAASALLSLGACVDAAGNQTAIGAKVAAVQAQIAAVTGITAEQQTCALTTDLAYRKSGDPAFKAMSEKQRGLTLAADCGIDVSQWAAVVSLVPGD